MKNIGITEYHCCCDCNYQIDVPDKLGYYKSGCLHPQGKPNGDGGLCRCDFFEGE